VGETVQIFQGVPINSTSTAQSAKKTLSFFVIDSYSHRPYACGLMKNPSGIRTRLVAAMLVTVAVVGLSAFAVHTPAQNQNSLARSLKSIQTDKATVFYASAGPDCAWFVEQVLPGTSESKAATENLKLIAAAL
jgi:hypothetical protein